MRRVEWVKGNMAGTTGHPDQVGWFDGAVPQMAYPAVRIRSNVTEWLIVTGPGTQLAAIELPPAAGVEFGIGELA